MTLGRMMVKIGADDSGLKSALNGTISKIQKVGDQLTRLGTGMSAGITAPIAAAGAAALAASIKVGNMADRILDLTEITGLSTDTLQEFKRIAVVAGIEQEALSGAAEGLTRRLRAGGDEAKSTVDAFNAIGLSIRDANGEMRSMDAIMADAISGLAGMDNITERNAVAMQIFGRRASELAPMLGLGTEAIEAARKEAHEMGLVLSGDTLQSANAFRIEWETLKQTMGVAATEIGVAMIPVMQTLVGILQQHVVPAFQSVVRWISDLSPATVITAGAIAGFVAAIGPLLLTLGGIIKALPLIKAGFLALGTPAAGPIGVIIAAVGALGFAALVMIKNWDVVKVRMLLIWSAIKMAVFDAVDGVLGILERLTSRIPRVGAAIKDIRRDFDQFAENSLANSGRKLYELETALNDAATPAVQSTTTATQELNNTLKETAESAAAAAAQLKAMEGVKPTIQLAGHDPVDMDRVRVIGEALKPYADAAFKASREAAEAFALSGQRVTALNEVIRETPGALERIRVMADSVGGTMMEGAKSFGGELLNIFSPVSIIATVFGEVIRMVVSALGEELAPIIEALAPSIVTIVKLFAAGLIPILTLLEPVLEKVAWAFSYVMEAIGWFIEAIGKFVDSIIPDWISKAGKGIAEMGQTMQDNSRAARNSSDSLEKTADAADRLTDSLLGAVRGFKIDAYRWDAMMPVTPSTGGGGGSGGGTGSSGGGGSEQPSTAIVPVSFGDVNIQTSGEGRDTYRAFYEELDLRTRGNEAARAIFYALPAPVT